MKDMKGLLGLLILVCLERRALAQDCNDIDCNPSCFVPQLHDLTLAISQETNDGTCLINSTGITSWSVNLKVTDTAISRRDGHITCGIMDSTCNIPFDCVNSSVVKLECNLKWMSPTNCDTGIPDSPVLKLELTVRCCKKCQRRMINHCVGVAVDDSQTLATGWPPNCDTTSETPSEPLSEIPSETPLSETPSGTEKEGESSASTSSTVTIVASVLGCLVVLILAALLALQLIRIFRKRKYHQHTISGRTENSDTTSQNMYAQRSPLPGEPAPYECAVVNGSGAKNLPLHPQQPSPYETATVTNGVYSLLGPPDEIQSRGQHGGNRTDTTVDQHIYEDADRYVSSPECGIANADYEVSLKSARDPNKSLRPGTDGDDYAVPDDALFDDEKYETQPKTIKSAGGGNDRAPISTQYQPSEDNDYSVPSDAIIEETNNQESDDGILNPLYHDLGKNMKQVKPNNDPSRTGVPKGKATTVESTMYEPAVSAPGPSTARSDMEPDTSTTSRVETETTSSGTDEDPQSLKPDPPHSDIPSLLKDNKEDHHTEKGPSTNSD
jgi:hypothetical protein